MQAIFGAHSIEHATELFKLCTCYFRARDFDGLRKYLNFADVGWEKCSNFSNAVSVVDIAIILHKELGLSKDDVEELEWMKQTAQVT